MWRLLPLVLLLLAACTGETAVSTTLPAEPPSPSTSSTSTTVVETTTTTVAEGPVDICQPQTVIWESGGTYTASCFVLPWSVVAPGDGWRAPLIDGGSMLVSWIDRADVSTTRVNVALIVGAEDVEDLESIVSIDGVDEVDSGSSVVDGRDTAWVDLEGRSLGSNAANNGCATDGTGGVLFRGGVGNGYWIATAPGGGSPPDSLGVGACDVARIWVLEIEGRTVTIIGGTADPARHAEAVAKIEELFEGMSFEVGAGS